MQILLNIAASLLPVFIFLAALIALDTFRLIGLSSVLRSVAIGCLVAVIAYGVNVLILGAASWNFTVYTRYAAPVIEECAKAVWLIYLIRSRKIGFPVDAAIYGFAIGAGFSFVENIYYLNAAGQESILYWLIRGLGTALMHGGTTALLGIISMRLSARRSAVRFADVLYGLLVAIAIHSMYNHLFLNPVLSTLVMVTVLPLLILVVFHESEKSTRHWLGIGLDTDLQLLEMINTGNVAETRIGEYFRTLQQSFRGEVLADMLCLIRLHVELSIRAKGILLMRSAGYEFSLGSDLREKFAELKYLERSIGRMGQLAIAPFLYTSSRDLWQIAMLEKS